MCLRLLHRAFVFCDLHEDVAGVALVLHHLSSTATGGVKSRVPLLVLRAIEWPSRRVSSDERVLQGLLACHSLLRVNHEAPTHEIS